MTPTQLKEAAQVMLAASEGKQVQYMSQSQQEWKDIPQSQQEWKDILDPSWDWYSNRYRIKPEPREPEPREWWINCGRVYEYPSTGFIKVREVI